jgi:hypothetical protein
MSAATLGAQSERITACGLWVFGRGRVRPESPCADRAAAIRPERIDTRLASRVSVFSARRTGCTAHGLGH